jgi:hypothetical protein
MRQLHEQRTRSAEARIVQIDRKFGDFHTIFLWLGFDMVEFYTEPPESGRDNSEN